VDLNNILQLPEIYIALTLSQQNEILSQNRRWCSYSQPFRSFDIFRTMTDNRGKQLSLFPVDWIRYFNIGQGHLMIRLIEASDQEAARLKAAGKKSIVRAGLAAAQKESENQNKTTQPI